MELFFSGLIAGVLLERFHLIKIRWGILASNDCIKPEAMMGDLFFLGLIVVTFALMTQAVRSLAAE